MTDEQAKKTYERALKMEHEFGEYFTGKEIKWNFLWWQWKSNDKWNIFAAVIQGDTIEEIYSKSKQAIWSQSGKEIWVPSKESLWQPGTTTWTLPPRFHGPRPVSRNQQYH